MRRWDLRPATAPVPMRLRFRSPRAASLASLRLYHEPKRPKLIALCLVLVSAAATRPKAGRTALPACPAGYPPSSYCLLATHARGTGVGSGGGTASLLLTNPLRPGTLAGDQSLDS